MRKFIFSLVVFFGGLSLFFLFYTSISADGNLFAYWKFDETVVGSPVVDSSGNGFNGTPVGFPQPSENIPPVDFTDLRSLYFDGDGDYVDIPDWEIDMSAGFSVSVWASPSAVTSWARFIDFGNGPASDNIVFGRNGTSSTLFFEIYDGASTTKVEAANAITLNEWHLYVATIDEHGNTVLYKDGDIIQTGTTNPPSALINRTVNYIGRSNWGGDAYYQGYMDELRIYDRALTPEEVEELAEGEPGPDVPTPTPTPTLTPTPPSPFTPTPGGGGGGSSSGNGSVSAPSCTAFAPIYAPDLFQIDANDVYAIVYFSPVSGANNYFVSYGEGDTTEVHGVQFDWSNGSGVIAYQINDLLPHTDYSFKVRAGNGCAIGAWSNIMQVTTSNSSTNGTSFYKNFASRVLSFFPRTVNNAGAGSNVLGASTKSSVKGCRDYTVKAGDSLWSIAAQNLGSGAHYTSIMSSNSLSSTLLSPGQTLKIGC